LVSPKNKRVLLILCSERHGVMYLEKRVLYRFTGKGISPGVIRFDFALPRMT